MSGFLIAILVLVNVVTFFVYGIDKWKARHNRWRIPEANLLNIVDSLKPMTIFSDSHIRIIPKLLTIFAIGITT